MRTAEPPPQERRNKRSSHADLPGCGDTEWDINLIRQKNVGVSTSCLLKLVEEITRQWMSTQAMGLSAAS